VIVKDFPLAPLLVQVPRRRHRPDTPRRQQEY
jgi:hypothetical protein